MKRAIFSFIIVLVIVFVTLSLLDARSEYTAEKLLYKASRIYKEIALNPDVAPPRMLASVERGLRKVVTRFPDGKTAKTAHVKLVEIYFTHKEYDKAIPVADEILKKYKDDIATSSKAQFIKAACYEMKNEWDNALAELTILKEKYLNTALGLQVPFYIASYYRKKDNPQEAKKAFQEAAVFYKGLKENNKGTMLGYASSTILLQVYMYLEQYEDAGNLVEDIITDYPGPMTMMQQLPYAEMIFVKILNRPQRAIKIYNLVKEKTQNEKMKQLLGAKIKQLEDQLEDQLEGQLKGK